MTKYEELYGVPVSYFPHEEENVREKLRLATEKLNEYQKGVTGYVYEQQLVIHEYNQAISWCRKILEDIQG